MVKQASAAQVRKVGKNTLKALTLGQSFAEYDKLLEKPNVFVETPAVRAATDENRAKCFFVGRRGTGKTAIALHLERKRANTILLLPQLLAPLEKYFGAAEMADVHQQPFKTLVTAFKRALLLEVLLSWRNRGLMSFDKRLPAPISRERNYVDDYDFDLRLLAFTEEGFEALKSNNDKEWRKQITRFKELLDEVDAMRHDSKWDTIILIDRIDESWDGSDKAVVLLMALMHACVELISSCPALRPLLFLRENIFERVRLIDKEFSRLETFVVPLDWTRELLLELVERRLNVPLIAKFPLNGETWRAFFEEPLSGPSSQELVFDYCQYRPRDVLTYCSFAVESAQSRLQQQIQVEDLYAARRRFSDSRLKDLSDEYAENYPQLQLVIRRFYGLGKIFTLQALSDFIKKLLVDVEVREQCQTWIYRYTQPDLFIRLLYDIGFIGLKNGDSEVQYRSVGPQSTTPPGISKETLIVIHPTYGEALNLQNIIINSLPAEVTLQQAGVIGELPGAIDLAEYRAEIQTLQERLRSLPSGEEHSDEFEQIVGEIIKLCFFTALTNPEHRVRDVDGRVIRDWIVGNYSNEEFWSVVRQKYGATQIVWECKNYSDLSASDFHQAAYYMSDQMGKFVIIAFRGREKPKHYYQHIRRISEKHGMVLLFDGRDLDVFLRHALTGKSNQPHIQELYDATVRYIA